MSDSYRIKAGMVPGLAGAGGGKFISVEGLPEHTVRHMAMF
jgi:hypothetical protein